SYLYFAAQSSPTYARLPYIDLLTDTATSNVLATFAVLPELLGYTTEKNYLVLFQNNGELRPTGGFIGSVGELRIKNGRVEEFVIQDVYDIDGQIKTHTEPPFVVRRYLQPHLYLRDSNFALDFQEAATTAAQLYREGGGETVDGVIGIDYDVLKKVIEVTGPLTLPTYNKTIDEKTGFDFIQSTIEDTFSPGNSQKRGLLSEIFSQLTFKLESPQNLFAIAKTLPELVEQKHILFAFKDPVLQEIFTVQKYGGTLTSQRNTQTNTLPEYLMVNEANIGINKANTSITRTVSLYQRLSEKSLVSNATLTLDNARGKEAYKVYVRFVVPQTSTFEELSINGTVTPTTTAITSARLYEAPSFTPPKDIELTQENYQDKTVFGFVHTVPAGKKDTFTMTYSRDIQLPTESFIYELTYQTQPGTHNTPFALSLEFPDTFTAHDKKTGSVAQKKFSVSQVTAQDIEVLVDFQKK
ncbi:MAG TPA: DUF4012 domain-containing protein, partial [Candidatus Levybacteria bacterium]|nr:DUF4012 domain-containing protein [Candidatus Levybacteria bacterium]